mmetsp:Transcript_24583/g.46654  ORF Transcript_24583/g.46654 Transcript_24583/m.46654 type:complete len:107 (+) Transcript_24583:289-609(+)
MGLALENSVPEALLCQADQRQTFFGEADSCQPRLFEIRTEIGTVASALATVQSTCPTVERPTVEFLRVLQPSCGSKTRSKQSTVVVRPDRTLSLQPTMVHTLKKEY